MYFARLAVALLSVALPASLAHASFATFEKVGDPQWNLVGDVLFSAPIGTGASSYAEFLDTQGQLFPEPNHLINSNGVVPGAAHAGPYDNEFIDGVVANGYKQGPNFTAADFSNGEGIWLGFLAVPGPGAPTGKSPDYASGPIIPNSTFPITITGLTTRNGVDFDSAWNYTGKDVNTNINDPSRETYDGYSHDIMLFAESIDFGPLGTAPAGQYHFVLNLTDTSGAGYKVSTDYSVSAVPLPPALALSIPGILVAGLAYLRARRVV